MHFAGRFTGDTLGSVINKAPVPRADELSIEHHVARPVGSWPFRVESFQHRESIVDHARESPLSQRCVETGHAQRPGRASRAPDRWGVWFGDLRLTALLVSAFSP